MCDAGFPGALVPLWHFSQVPRTTAACVKLAGRQALGR